MSAEENMVEDSVETGAAADAVGAEDVLELRRSKRLRGAVSLPGDAHQAIHACALAALSPEPVRIANLPMGEDGMLAPWFAEYRAALEAIGVTFAPVTEAVDGPAQWLVHGGTLRAPDASGPLDVPHELAALALAGLCSGRGLDVTLRLDSVRVPGDTLALLRALYPQPEASDGADARCVRITEPVSRARHQCKPFERGWDDGLAKVVLLFHHLAAGEALELHLRRQGGDVLENLMVHFETGLRVERDDDKEADELTRRIARQMRAAGKEVPVTRLLLPGGARVSPVFIALAGDATEAAALALAATLVRGSDIGIEGVLLNTGRSGALSALRRMGADVEVIQRREPRQGGGEAQGTLRVRAGELTGRRFGGDTVPDWRDEVFLLIAAAASAEGESVFRDLDWLRSGEVDVLRAFTQAIKRGGVETGEIEDGVVVRGRAETDGGAFDTLGHPGLALACLVLAVKSHGGSTLAGASALERRHPGLRARLASLEAAPASKSRSGDGEAEDSE